VEILERLIRFFVRNPHFVLVAIFILASVVRSIVQGVTQAKRRQKEVEQRRESRGEKKIELEEMFEPREEAAPEPEPEPPPAMWRGAPPAPAPPPPPPPAPRSFADRIPLTTTLAEPAFPRIADVTLAPALATGISDLSSADPEPEAVAPRAELTGFRRELDEWRSAVILTEVLGPPVSMRGAPGAR
jgi:hypothetical protein